MVVLHFGAPYRIAGPASTGRSTIKPGSIRPYSCLIRALDESESGLAWPRIFGRPVRRRIVASDDEKGLSLQLLTDTCKRYKSRNWHSSGLSAAAFRSRSEYCILVTFQLLLFMLKLFDEDASTHVPFQGDSSVTCPDMEADTSETQVCFCKTLSVPPASRNSVPLLHSNLPFRRFISLALLTRTSTTPFRLAT